MGDASGDPGSFAGTVGTCYRARLDRPVHHELAFPYCLHHRISLCGRQPFLPYRRDLVGDARRVCDRRCSRVCRSASAVVERHGAKNTRAVHRRHQRTAEDRTRPPYHRMVRNGQRSDRLHDGARRRDRRHHARPLRVYRDG